MEWSSGFSASYHLGIVDPVTWRDIEYMDVTGGTIKRDLNDLRQSATVDVTDYPYSLEEKWLRVYLVARQEGDIVRVPLFTGLATSANKDINGELSTHSLDCYSVLKPASDVLLPRGWYASEGGDGPELIYSLLRDLPAPVSIDETGDADKRKLDQVIIAEDGESRLTMTDKILSAINWRLVISGDGRITIKDVAKDLVANISSLDYDVIEPKLSLSYDWYECPNIFRAVNDDDVYEAKDEDENSIFSIPSRGREVWVEETSCDLSAYESLKDYAERRLKECQQVAMTLNYDRRFDPAIDVTDRVYIHYPVINVDGQYLITSQSIEIGYGARTSEEAVAV